MSTPLNAREASKPTGQEKTSWSWLPILAAVSQHSCLSDCETTLGQSTHNTENNQGTLYPNLSYHNTLADYQASSKHLKLPNYSAGCCNYIARIYLFAAVMLPPLPISVLLTHQNNFGRNQVNHFTRYQIRQHHRTHVLKDYKMGIYFKFKKQNEIKFLDKNYSHSIHVVIFYFIFEMKPLYIVQTITTDGINK